MSINKTGAFFLFVLCSYIFFITSCTDRLYFDSAPKSNIDLVKKELSKWPNLTGVYKLNISYLDSTADHFKLNKFNGYAAPVLQNNIDDTLKYLGSFLLGNRYLEITENHGVCHFLNFDCINKNIFNHFFSGGTRIIKEKGKCLGSISAIFKNDSITVRIRNYEKQISSLHDTTIKFKAWTRGELLCFSKDGESYFPKSIDLNSSNSAFNYFSVIQNQLYYIRKDTTHNKTKFEISNLLLGTNSFILRVLNKYETTDTVLNKLGVKYEDDLIHLNESQLISLFKSPLASDEVTADRIEGFPLSSEEKDYTIWYIISILVMIFFTWLIRISKKKTGT
ncbi:MAG: hypothetical protein ACXVPU_08690 [Bacteroidia bacterium]